MYTETSQPTYFYPEDRGNISVMLPASVRCRSPRRDSPSMINRRGGVEVLNLRLLLAASSDGKVA
jgi:hypothetical protein